MNILTVCGMGSGSSLILKINVEEVLSELNIKGSVNTSDVGSYKGSNADIIFSTHDLASQFKSSETPVVLLDTIFDKEEIKEAIQNYKKEVK